MSNIITHDNFVQNVYNIYGDKYAIVSKYTRANKYVDIQCNRCNTIFSRKANSVTSRKSICCPLCDSKKVSNIVIKNINDLWTVRPDVANLLVDKEEGYLYRENSEYETDFICPYCNLISTKKIKNVSAKGFNCPFCNDYISYPNKFMANFLRDMNVVFKSEYVIKPYLYRYDFYFEFNNKQYVVELDGAYGHGEFDTKNKNVSQQIFDDEEKDRIAKENGFIMIRIDCKYKNLCSRFNYIKQAFNSSLLKEIFIYNDDLLVQIDRKCEKSIIVEMSEKWNQGVCSYEEFEKIFGINRPGIRRYLKRACEVGLINIDYEILLNQIRLSSNKKLAITKGQKIKCNETGEEFYSIAEAERQTGFCIRNYLYRKNSKYCGKLSDGTKLTWSFVTE